MVSDAFKTTHMGSLCQVASFVSEWEFAIHVRARIPFAVSVLTVQLDTSERIPLFWSPQHKQRKQLEMNWILERECVAGKEDRGSFVFDMFRRLEQGCW